MRAIVIKIKSIYLRNPCHVNVCTCVVTYNVFSVCFDELISQAVAHSVGITSPSILSSCICMADPTCNTTGRTTLTDLILNGALLAVGGSHSSDIHLYQPILAVGDGCVTIT